MTARDTLPADPELLAARPPNPAVDARPGWRGTDPDGGTWLRRFPDAESEWFEFTANGHLVLRSQEEAEAAGLVAVVAETEVTQARRERDEALAEMRAERPAPLDHDSRRTDADRREDAELFLAHWPGGKRLTAEDRGDFIAGWTGWHAGIDFDHECDVRDRLAAVAAPAPLDPDDPVDLRRHARLSRYLADEVANLRSEEDALEKASDVADRTADRLDRKQRVPAQDEGDRELGPASALIASGAPHTRPPRRPAPVPLDPGDPEHLRAHAAASYRLAALLPGTQDGETLEMAAGIAEWRAECLDRERAEAEQEAAEAAKLAAVLADFSIYDTDGSRDDAILAGHLVRRGVRVIEERARQEAGQ